VGVDDKRYDFDGIKPGGRHLTAEDAIWNAESYAYFATDLAGALPRRDFAEAYR
jgi:hypothetical protein